MAKKLQHVNRPLTDEERQQAVAIRAGTKKDFPPVTSRQKTSPSGMSAQIQEARKQRGITRYELGRLSGVPSTTVRAIEEGDDVSLSQFHAVVAALGLVIELVEQD